MTAPVFVDTNVLVYRFDTTVADKQQRAERWLDYLWEQRLGRVSTQVQNELYAVFTRKLSLPGKEARRIVAALEAWAPVATDGRVAERAWVLEDRHSLSWWDALIVAAAQVAGASVLLTEDLDAGAVYGAVRVVDPFRQAPPEPSIHEREAPRYE